MLRTTIIPNPVRLEQFAENSSRIGEPPTVLVLGRIAFAKGLEDVVALATSLAGGKVDVRFRIVGKPSLHSDYTRLLDELPPENAEYIGGAHFSQVPAELARSDLLLQASKYEPFGLTVSEALAAGVPVVATSNVGAIEDVDRTVVAAVTAGDVGAMATAISTMLDRVRTSPTETRAKARAEAERLFAPDLVCEKISIALEQLVDGGSAPPLSEPRVPRVRRSLEKVMRRTSARWVACLTRPVSLERSSGRPLSG